MKKYLVLISFFVSLVVLQAEAQCDISTFSLTPISGVCAQDGQVQVNITDAITCTGGSAVSATIRAAGASVDSDFLILSATGTGNFSNLAPGEYEVRLTQGANTSDPQIVSVSSSYSPFEVNFDAIVGETCRVSDMEYEGDGSVTASVNRATTGTYTYEIQSLGLTSGPITAQSYSFTDLVAGSYVLTITETVAGCTASIGSGFTIDPYTGVSLPTTPVTSGFGFFTLIQNDNCSAFHLSVTRTTGNTIYFMGSQESQARVLGPNGYLTISYGGNTYPYSTGGQSTGFVNPSSVYFENIPPNTEVTIEAFDGCNIRTHVYTTPPIIQDYLSYLQRSEYRASTCQAVNFIRIEEPNFLGVVNTYPTSYDITYNFYQEQPLGSGNWVQLDNFTANRPDRFRFFPLQNGSSTYNLINGERYRIERINGCNVISDDFIFNLDEETNPLDQLSLQEVGSVLGGTSAIRLLRGNNFLGYDNVFSELEFSISRTDGATSYTYSSENPYSYAENRSGNTISFPVTFTHDFNQGSFRQRLINLPLGEYEVTVTDPSCGSSVTRTINLVNPTLYNSILEVEPLSCGAFNLNYDLGRNTTSADYTLSGNTLLLDANGNTVLSSNTAARFSGTFSNLAPGTYSLRYFNASFVAERIFDLSQGSGSINAGNHNNGVINTSTFEIEPLAPVTFSTSSFFCDPSDNDSGILSVVLSGVPIGSISYRIWNATANPSTDTPLQEFNTTDLSETSHVFQNLSQGNYIVRVVTDCGFNEQIVTITQGNTTFPPISASGLLVCANEGVTLTLGLPPSLFDIEWFDGATSLGTGNSIEVFPSESTTYTVRYALSSSFGCSSAASWEDDIQIQVDLVAPVIDGELDDEEIEGCGIDNLPPAATSITQLLDMGLTISDNITDTSDLSLSHNDVLSGTCPLTVTRTYTIGDACGNGSSIDQVFRVGYENSIVISPDFTDNVAPDMTVDCNNIPRVPRPQRPGPGVEPWFSDICDTQLWITYLGEERIDVDDDCPNSYILIRRWEARNSCEHVVVHEQTITVVDATGPEFTEVLPVDISVECGEIPDPLNLTASGNCSEATVTSIDYILGNTPEDKTGLDNTDALQITYASSDPNDGLIFYFKTGSALTYFNSVTFYGMSFSDIPAGVGEVRLYNASENPASISSLVGTVGTYNYNGASFEEQTFEVTASGNLILFPETVYALQFDAPLGYAVPGNIGPNTLDFDSDLDWTYISSNMGVSVGETPISTILNINAKEFVSDPDACNSYDIIRRYIAKDECDNRTEHIQIITVVDTIAPEITGVLEDQEIEGCGIDDVPAAVMTIADLEALGLMITDNCTDTSNLTLTHNDVPSGTCPLTVTRTYTIADACGNGSSIDHVFRVGYENSIVISPDFTDNVAPDMTVDCNNVPPVPRPQRPGPGVVPWFSDICDTQLWITYLGEERRDVDDDCPNSYILIRRWEARNSCEHVVVHEQTITVVDTTGPEITGVLEDQEIEGCGIDDVPAAATTIADLEALGLTITDNCTDTSNLTLTHNDVLSGTCPLTVTRTYTIGDACGNGSSIDQIFRVGYENSIVISPDFTDNVAPDMTVDCNNIPPVPRPQRPGPGVVPWFSDICDTQLWITYLGEERRDVDDDCPNSYILIRRWEARNSCEHVVVHEQTITVVDTTGPEITGVLEDQEIEGCGIDDVPAAATTIAELEALGLTITDNCTDTVDLIVTSSDVSTGTCPVTVTRTYTIADACGNESSVVQIFTVENTTPLFVNPDRPSIFDDQIIERGGSCRPGRPVAPPSQELLDALFISNCGGPITVTIERTTVSGDCPELTITTIRYIGEDACGNIGEYVQTNILVDTTPPVFIEDLPEDIAVSCNEVPAAPILTATDGTVCAVPVVTFEEERTDGECPNSYVLTRKWTATDECGNETVHTQVITVEDTEAPVITGELEDQEIEGCGIDDVPAAATTIAELEALGLTITDNCTATGDLIVTSSDVSSGTCPVTVTRTYTIADACGNGLSIEQIFRVETINSIVPSQDFLENVAPDGIVVDCSNVPQVPRPLRPGPGIVPWFSDTCGLQLVITYVGEERIDGDCPNNYTLIRRWTAENACGEIYEHVQTIRVEDTNGPEISGELEDQEIEGCEISPNVPAPVTTITELEALGLMIADNCTDTSELIITSIDVVSGTSSETITRTYTIADGCGNESEVSQVFTLIVVDIPEAGENGILTICEGEAVSEEMLFASLGGTPDAKGTWTDNGDGTWTYTVAATAPCTEDAISIVEVVVVDRPDAGENGTLTICEGEVITEEMLFASLGGTPDAGGTWSDNGDGTWTYTVAATAPCTEEAFSIVEVVIVDNPEAGENGTLTICEGEAVTEEMLFASLGGTPDTTGTWTDNGDGTWTYTVAATAPCTQEAISIVTVVIVDNPEAGENSTLTICEGEVVSEEMLFASLGGTPDTTGTWTDNGDGTWTYTVAATAPCTEDAISIVEVLIVDIPEAGENGILTICEGEVVTEEMLFASLGGTPDDTGTWNDNGDGTWTYTVAATAPCTEEATSLVTVVVVDNPEAGENGTLMICEGEAVTEELLFTSLGGNPDNTGTWTDNGDGTWTYTVAATTPCTEDAISIVEVLIVDIPEAGENGILTICEGEAVTEEMLFASLGGTPDATGTWSDNGDGTWTYAVAATAPCTEDAISIVEVVIVDNPEAGENGTLTICEGEAVTEEMLFASLGGTPDAGGTWTDNGDGTWTYTVAATAPCTEDAISIVEVLIVDIPEAGENGILTICEGEVITEEMLFASLGGTPDAGGTWSDNGDGTWTYTVAATAPCTEAATSVVTVVVVDIPEAGENGTLTICEGEVVTEEMLFASLGGTPDAGGTWTDNGDGTWTYTIAATAPCTEDAISIVEVVIVDNPEAGENGTLTICEGEAVTEEMLFASLGGTPDAGGTWTDNGDGTWIYTKAATAPCTEDAISIVEVVIVDNPEAGENGTLTICEGEVVTEEMLFASLGGNPDDTGTWTNNGNGTWTYTVAATAPCTEEATSIVIVVIVDIPEAGENGTLTICEGEAVTEEMLFASLGGTPDAGGTWTDNGDGTWTYTVAATAPCTEEAFSIVEVVIVDNPEAGENGTLTICEGEVITEEMLFASLGGTPDTTGTWSDNGDGTWTYTVAATAPCTEEATSIVTVVIVDIPEAGENGILTICEGEAVTEEMLFASLGGTPDAGGTWTDNGDGTWTYTVAATAPCTEDAISIVIVVIVDIPEAGENGILTICEGEVVTEEMLFASLGGNPDDTGTWTDNGDGTWTYTVAATAPCTEDAISIVEVLIVDIPEAGENGTLTICEGEVVTEEMLFASLGGTPDTTGTWTDNGDGTWTYTVAATAPCTEEATSLVTVVVVDNPEAGENGTLTICEGEVVTEEMLFASLGGTPDTTGTWSDNGDGTWTYRVAATAPCTEDAISIVEVVIVDNLEAGENGTLTICEGEVVTEEMLFASLGGTPDAGGTWTDNGDGTWTYTIAATAPCTEEATSIVIVVIVDIPEAGENGILTICEGEVVTEEMLFASLGGTPDAGGTWTDNGDGTWTYTVAATAPCTEEATSIVIVVIVDIPEAGENGILTICEGEVVTEEMLFASLGGNPDDTGTWTDNGDGTWTYTVAATAPCTEDAISIVEVLIVDIPEAGENGTLTICEGEVVTEEMLFASLGGTPDTTGTWTDNGDGTWTYTVAATAPCTEEAIATVTVVVVDIPEAGEDGTLTICEGEAVTEELLFTSLGGNPDNTGTWNDNGDGTWTYTVAATAPCTEEATSLVTVVVVDNPEAGENGTLTICEGEVVTEEMLFASLGGTPDTTGTWSDNGDGTWTYTVAATAPCIEEAIATVTVVVVDSPEAGENGILTICEGEVITEEMLFASLGGTPDTTGTWSDNGDGTWTYTVAPTAPCTEEATSIVTVVIVDIPEAGENGILTICEGEAVTEEMLFASLGGTPDAGGTWSDNGDGTWTYTVAAIAPCTEEAISIVEVVIVDNPEAGENGILTICEGEVITEEMLFASLGGTPDAGGTWNNNGDGTWTYTVAATAPCTEEATSIVIVVIVDIPEAGENGILTICEGEVVTEEMLFASLGGNPDDTGTWTNIGDGTWTYTVAATAPCTEEATSIVIVVIVDIPEAGENGTLTICEGEAVTEEMLFASLGGTPDAGGTWTDNGDGTWTYTVAATAPCTEDAISIVEVLIVDIPEAGENGTLTICEGEVVTEEMLFASLGGTPDAGGTWTDNGDGTWTYTVAATASCTEAATSVVTVVVVDIPEAGENGTLTICEGETVSEEMLFASLGGTPDAGGTWTDNGDGTWTYTVAATAPCTEDAISIVEVVVVDRPDAGENGILTICEGEVITEEMLFASLGGTPDTTGTWSDNGDGTWTYTVAPTAPCTEEATSIVTVVIVDIPEAGENGILTICEGEAVTEEMLFASLGGTPDAGGTWSDNGDGTWTYTVAAIAPCTEEATSLVIVVVVDNPEAGENGTLTICEGETVSEEMLFASLGGIPDAGGTWTDNGDGTWTYTVAATAPCTEDAISIVEVVRVDNPEAGENGTLTICEGETVSEEMLFASLGGTPDAGGTWTDIGDGTWTYRVAATAPCTEEATSVVTVVVVDRPDAGESGILTICEGEVVTEELLFTSLGGNPDNTGTWNDNGDGTWTYTVAATAPCTEAATSVVTINVNEVQPPAANEGLTICLENGDSLTATATVNDGEELLWYASEDAITPIQGLPTLSSVGTITYWAEAVSELGCRSVRVPVTLTINDCQVTIVKEVDQDQIYGPTILNYTMTLTNPGNTALTGIVVTDPLTDANTPLTLVSGDTNGDGNLDTDEIWVYNASFEVTQAMFDLGNPVENTAFVTTNQTGQKDASSTTIIEQNADLTIVKTAVEGSTFASVDDVINYTIVVTNTGNVTLSNIVVTDPLTGLNQIVSSLAPNGSVSIPTSYTVVQADIDRGFVRNVATATVGEIEVSDEETVTHIPKPIVATNDVYGPINGSTGGTFPSNVLDNDTLNGAPVNPEDVILTPINIDPDSPVVINPDGTVTVSPNTPAGEYEVEYSICEVLNTTNCDEAKVTVTVTATEIEANDDDFGVYPVGFGGVLGNILENDRLNGMPIDPSLVDFEIIDLGGVQGLIISPEGTISLVPGLNAVGTYVMEYRICEIFNTGNCDNAFIRFSLESQTVDLSITKTSNDVTIWEGDEFEYLIQVSNIGGTDATDVMIIDNLPNGLSFVGESRISSISGLNVSFSIQGNRLTWTLLNFPAGAVLDIRLQVRANSLSNGSVELLTNIVTVSSEEQDVDQSNNTDTDVNRINPFFIPNVITPGDDGKNDRFVIKGIGKFVSNNIVIFNRYGDHVYESSDYQNNWSAEGLPAGTFYYVFNAVDSTGKTHVFKGWIQVIKD